MTDRRVPGNTYSTANDQVGSSGFQRPTNPHPQQPRWSFSALPEEDVTMQQQPRINNSSDLYTTQQQQPRINSSADPYTTNQQQLRTNSLSDPYTANQPSFADHGRLSDPVQRPTTSHNLSITDTDKLQQRGHENVTGGDGYRGDSYRGDRIPSRYAFNEMAVPDPQNVGGHNPVGFPVVERMPNFPRYFYGDMVSTSTPAVAAASSYSRRSAWSDSSQPQVVIHAPNYENIL